MPDRFYLLISKKLSDTASTSEIEELERLCSADDLLRREYHAIEVFWKTRKTAAPYNLQAFEKHIQRLKVAGHPFGYTPEKINNEPLPELATTPNSKIKPLKRLSLWVAAAVILGVSISLLWISRGNYSFNYSNTAKSQEVLNEVQTRPGSRSKMVLPDGSEVWVNASSRLTYDQQFGKTHRNIQLDGEAYFMVEKNENIPFVLQTKNISIRVTGTVFNVRAYDNEDRTETALVEGSVQVQVNTHPEKIYKLAPSQKLIVTHPADDRETEKIPIVRSAFKNSDNAIVALSEVNYTASDSLLVETAWLYGTLAFNDESFFEVSQKMEKWYDVEIVFESSNLEKIRFSGTFTKESVKEALEALQYTANFKFRQNGNRIIIFNQ
jgi:transmembrane sensor